MTTERLTFPGGAGVALAARLELPDGLPRATALFAHCFTCGKDSLAATHLARGLTRAGIATLRFDFTGLGGSEGDFANTGFTSNVDDLVAAADTLAERGMPPALLIGHSLGGAAVLAAAHRIACARAVVTLNAPGEVAHVLDQLGPGLARIEADGEAEVTLAGRPFRISRAFVDDVRGAMLAERIGALGRALLICHAPGDRTVPVTDAARIFAAAHHPKSFVALAGADHMLSGPGDADYAAQVIAAWAGRYL